jgi:hypothetical protein
MDATIEDQKPSEPTAAPMEAPEGSAGIISDDEKEKMTKACRQSTFSFVHDPALFH